MPLPLTKNANVIVEGTKEEVAKERSNTKRIIDFLGCTKAQVFDTSVKRFLSGLETLAAKDIEFTESIGTHELKYFRFDKESLCELKKLQGIAENILEGPCVIMTVGAATVFGAYGAAAACTASADTAAASLSGVASSNATLAFLGGGSLVMGGMGIAGRSLVLGGLVNRSALEILSTDITQRDRDYTNLEARRFSEEMHAVIEQCSSIKDRAQLFINTLIHLDIWLDELLPVLDESIVETGGKYRRFDRADRENFAACCRYAQAIKALIVTPILTEDGNLTDKSLLVLSEARKVNFYRS